MCRRLSWEEGGRRGYRVGEGRLGAAFGEEVLQEGFSCVGSARRVIGRGVAVGGRVVAAVI